MTTIKEYKAMIDGASEGHWFISRHSETGVTADNERGICSTGGYSDNTRDSGELAKENKSNAEFIAASRNIAPDLIRVIELAEEGLDYALSQMQPFCSDEKVKQALSEIRKLRGE